MDVLTRVGLLVSSVLVLAVVPIVGAEHLGPQDRDCRNFRTWSEAQAFYVSAGAGDPHHLDVDGDGIACETLSGAPGEGGTPRPTIPASPSTPRATSLPRPNAEQPGATPDQGRTGARSSPTPARSPAGPSRTPSSPEPGDRLAPPANQSSTPEPGSSPTGPGTGLDPIPSTSETLSPERAPLPEEPATGPNGEPSAPRPQSSHPPESSPTPDPTSELNEPTLPRNNLGEAVRIRLVAPTLVYRVSGGEISGALGPGTDLVWCDTEMGWLGVSLTDDCASLLWITDQATLETLP